MKKTLTALIVGLFVLGFSNVAFGQVNAWINEIHYDNAGTDVGEFVEIVIEDAGSYTLSDFTVTLYNGSGGTNYGSETLNNFTVGTTSGNFTIYTWSLPTNGIQNGPDGLSLDYQGTVIQFLSYEGDFMATDGPANGATSTDIGVSESGSDPVGYSLQLSGSGTQYSEFTWQPPAEDTPGNLNNGQSFGGGGEVKPEPTNHVTDFTATADGWSKINLSWTENDGSVVPDGYLIKASTSDNVSDPIDGIPVADNPTIGDNSGAINLAHGTTTYQWAGLNAESTYYFKIYPYTNSGSAIDYKTDEPVPSANATTGTMPEIPNLMLSEIADPSDNPDARFVELYNYSGSVINFGEQTWYLCRQANGGSWGDVQLTGSISSGSTYIVAYNETFETAFGVSADLYSGFISGNGDDGYFLYYGGDHSSGTLVDAYGVIDQDGTGQPWEYEDCHAVRNVSVTEPNATWTASEWTIESATVAKCTPYVSTLPVTLSTFTATYVSAEQTVRLYWRTESETDNIGWYVYRHTEEDFANAMRLNNDLIPGYGTTSEPHDYIFEDRMIAGAMPGEIYWYWIESWDLSGLPRIYGPVNVVISTPPDEPDTPEPEDPIYGLHQNAPNPLVQGEVELSFCLPQSAHVELNIYNIRGELVKQVYSGFAAEDEITWDGRDAYGNLQPSGIYLYQLKVNGKVAETKKMIILR